MSDEARDAGVPAGEVIEWEARVPLLTSRFMLWDFGKVIVISIAIMYALVAVMGWFVDGEFVLLPLVAIPIAAGGMAALFAIACLLLGNRFTMRLAVGPDGVAYASGGAERRWNRAAIIIGILAGSAGTAGAGLLASSREDGGFPWSDIHRANEHPAQRVISLRDSWHVLLRLHCTPENYEQVLSMVRAGIAKGAAERSAEAADEVPAPKRPWYAYVAAVLVPVIAVILVTAWPWLQYEDGMRFVVLSGLLLIVAGLQRGFLRRGPAALSLVPTAYIGYLTLAEMLSTSEGWFPGEVKFGWEYDTALLAITLAGEAILVGLALWRLFGPDGNAPQAGSSAG